MTTPFGEIVALAKDRTTAGRRRLASQFGDAFLTHVVYFTPQERNLALEILATVLRDATVELRRELAAKLAHESGVPNKLVRTLANDSIDVALPVIQHSEDLRDEDLLEIIAKGTPAHRLAMAHRTYMNEPVAAALVARKELPVAQALLKNIAIHIPESVLRELAAQALERGEIAETIAQRSELTADIAERIYWIVSNELKAQITSRFDLDNAKLDKILNDLVQQLAAKPGTSMSRRNIADRLLTSGRVDAVMLTDILKNRGVGLFKDLLCGLTRFEPKVIDVLCRTECSEPLALVCRALGFAKTETASLLMLVNDRVAGQTQFDPAALAGALTTFSRMTVGDAKTVLWQWQSDPGYLLSLAARRPSGDQASGAGEESHPALQ